LSQKTVSKVPSPTSSDPPVSNCDDAKKLLDRVQVLEQNVNLIRFEPQKKLEGNTPNKMKRKIKKSNGAFIRATRE